MRLPCEWNPAQRRPKCASKAFVRRKRTQRASASASPRYASERDSQSRHCQSTTVACRTKGRGGSGWCGRIGGVSGGLSPPEHLLRATAPAGARDSAASISSQGGICERFQIVGRFLSDSVPDLRITPLCDVQHLPQANRTTSTRGSHPGPTYCKRAWVCDSVNRIHTSWMNIEDFMMKLLC